MSALEEGKRWKTSTERWCRKWNARMDELTATKGEVARLREALEQAAHSCADVETNTFGREAAVCGACRHEWPEHRASCPFAAISTPAAAIREQEDKVNG